MRLFLFCASLMIQMHHFVVNSVDHPHTTSPEHDIDWSNVQDIISIDADKEWRTYQHQIQPEKEVKPKTARQIRYEREKERMKLLEEKDPEKFNLRKEKRRKSQARARKAYMANLTPENKARYMEIDRLRARKRASDRKARTGYSTLKNEKFDKIRTLVAEGKATPAQEAKLKEWREAGKMSQRKRKERKKALRMDNDGK